MIIRLQSYKNNHLNALFYSFRFVRTPYLTGVFTVTTTLQLMESPDALLRSLSFVLLLNEF